MKKIIEALGYLSRKSLYFRILISKLGIQEKVRKFGLEYIIKLNYGPLFTINTKDWIGFRCFFWGSYDIEDVFVKKILKILKEKKIDNFLDIGANHGYYSLIISQNSPKTRIFSFEPSQKNYKTLMNNIKINQIKNIEVFKNVVREIHGNTKVYYSGDEKSGQTSCLPNNHTDKNPALIEDVENLIIDDIYIKNNIRGKNLFKIDVEGFELNVLKGMIDILTNEDNILFIEHNEETLNKNNDTTKDILKYLNNLNYAGYDVLDNDLKDYSGGDRGLVMYIKKP